MLTRTRSAAPLQREHEPARSNRQTLPQDQSEAGRAERQITREELVWICAFNHLA